MSKNRKQITVCSNAKIQIDIYSVRVPLGSSLHLLLSLYVINLAFYTKFSINLFADGNLLIFKNIYCINRLALANNKFSITDD